MFRVSGLGRISRKARDIETGACFSGFVIRVQGSGLCLEARNIGARLKI